MRKLALIGLTMMTVFAVAAVAIAQTPGPVLNVTGTVSPKRAGTKKKPKNAKINVAFTVNEESESTLSSIKYSLPKFTKLSGKGFPTCSVDQINNSGSDTCPKGSDVGDGAATALLGPDKQNLDFDVDVFVSGKNSLALYLQTSLFNIAIPAKISGGGRTVSFDIPERVQQPVPGLYSYVTSVTANLGKAKTGSGKKKKFFASVSGCKGGKHDYGVELGLADNPNPPASRTISKTDVSSACKAAKKKK